MDVPARLKRSSVRLPPVLPSCSRTLAVHGDRSSTKCACFSRSNPDPPDFRPDCQRTEPDVRRVRLERVSATEDNSSGNPQGYQGYLVFVRHEAQQAWKGGREAGLVVHVSGDSLYCLCLLLNGQEPTRPMPLNLLSGVLSHAGEHSSEDWGLVKVAIIALKGDTYIGRVYFGNRRTGQVTWDRDIRPSDATFLAERWKCPIYVGESIWAETTMSHAEFLEAHRLSSQQPATFDGIREEGASPSMSPTPRGEELGGDVSDGESDGKVATTTPPQMAQLIATACLRAGVLEKDPELVKVVKRSIAVAASEENYAHAAYLRDLPVMQLYKQALEHREKGELVEALDAERRMHYICERWTFDETSL